MTEEQFIDEDGNLVTRKVNTPPSPSPPRPHLLTHLCPLQVIRKVVRRVVGKDERTSEGEIVNDEGVAAAMGGGDFTPPAGGLGGKGKKRGKRSRQGHRAERCEVGIRTGGLGLMCLRPLTPA